MAGRFFPDGLTLEIMRPVKIRSNKEVMCARRAIAQEAKAAREAKEAKAEIGAKAAIGAVAVSGAKAAMGAKAVAAKALKVLKWLSHPTTGRKLPAFSEHVCKSRCLDTFSRASDKLVLNNRLPAQSAYRSTL